jgi:hypothetical protein
VEKNEKGDMMKKIKNPVCVCGHGMIMHDKNKYNCNVYSYDGKPVATYCNCKKFMKKLKKVV